jgi:hypothetical protein
MQIIFLPNNSNGYVMLCVRMYIYIYIRMYTQTYIYTHTDNVLCRFGGFRCFRVRENNTRAASFMFDSLISSMCGLFVNTGIINGK